MSGHGKGRHGGTGRPGDEAARPGELTDFAADRLLDRFSPGGDLALGRAGSEDYPDWEAVTGIGQPREYGGWEAEPRDGAQTRLLRRAASDTGYPGFGVWEAGDFADSGRVKFGRGDSGRADSGRGDFGRGDSGWAHSGQGDFGRAGSEWADSGRGDFNRADAGWADSGRDQPGTARADKAWRSGPGAAWSAAGEGPAGSWHAEHAEHAGHDGTDGFRGSDDFGGPARRHGSSGSWPADTAGLGAHLTPLQPGGFGDDDALTRLLRAAAAPARPHELLGYDPVRDAYEQAGAVVSRSRPVLGTPLARLAGFRFAALAGTLTVAGAAVAAEANALPAPIQRAAHTLLGPIGVPAPGDERDGSPTADGTGPEDQPTSGGRLPGTPGGTAGPSGALPGGGVPTSAAVPGGGTVTAGAAQDLCRAYTAGDGQGSTLTGDQRRQLVALAGGEKYVDAYCAAVLAGAQQPVPSPSPSDGAQDPTTSEPRQNGQGGGPATGNPGKGHTHTSAPGKSGHTTAGDGAATEAAG